MTEGRRDLCLAALWISLALILGIVANLAAVASARAEGPGPCSLYTPCSGSQVEASAGAVDRPRRPPAADPAILALIDTHASSAGVPASIARALVRHESGFKPHVRGAAGEWGLTQIKCPTARLLGFVGSCRDLANASTNLTWGLLHLRHALDRGGQGCAGVALHQLGLAARPRCTTYARQVLRRI